MASQMNSEFSVPRSTESLGTNVQSGWWDKTSCGSFYSSDGEASSSSGADYEAWHALGEFVARAREASLDPFEIADGAVAAHHERDWSREIEQTSRDWFAARSAVYREFPHDVGVLGSYDAAAEMPSTRAIARVAERYERIFSRRLRALVRREALLWELLTELRARLRALVRLRAVWVNGVTFHAWDVFMLEVEMESIPNPLPLRRATADVPQAVPVPEDRARAQRAAVWGMAIRGALGCGSVYPPHAPPPAEVRSEWDTLILLILMIFQVIFEELLKRVGYRYVGWYAGAIFGVFELCVYVFHWFQALGWSDKVSFSFFFVCRLMVVGMHAVTTMLGPLEGCCVHLLWNYAFIAFGWFYSLGMMSGAVGAVATGVRHFMVEDMGGEVEVLLKIWPLLECRSRGARLIMVRSMIRDLIPDYGADVAELVSRATGGLDELISMFETVLGLVFQDADGRPPPPDDRDWTTTPSPSHPTFGGMAAMRRVVDALGAVATDTAEVAWPVWAVVAFKGLVAVGATRIFRTSLIPTVVMEVVTSMAVVGLKPGDIPRALQDIMQKMREYRKTQTLETFFTRSATDPLVILQTAARLSALTDDDLVEDQTRGESYFRPRVTVLEEHIELIRGAMARADAPTRSALTTALRYAFERLERLEALAITAHPRRPPFTMLFVGPPGVGKSYLLRALFAVVATSFERPVDYASMYSVAQGQKYFDDYRTLNHWFVVLDDLMCVNPDKVSSADEIVTQIISFVNSAASRLNAAEINNKQKRWAAPDFVVATSNVKDLNAQFYGVGDGMALRRRFPWVVEVKVRKDYCKPGSTELDVGMLPLSGVPDAWQISISEIKVGGDDKLVEVVKDIGFADFVVWLARAVVAYRKKSSAAADALERTCEAVAALARTIVVPADVPPPVFGELPFSDLEAETVTVMARPRAQRTVPKWWLSVTRHQRGDWQYHVASYALWVCVPAAYGVVYVWSRIMRRRESLFARWVLQMSWSRPREARQLLMYVASMWLTRAPLSESTVDALFTELDEEVFQLMMWRAAPETLAGQRAFDNRATLVFAAVGTAVAVMLGWAFLRRRESALPNVPCMLRPVREVIAEQPSTWQRVNAQDAIGDPRIPGHGEGRDETNVPKRVFRDPVPIQSATTPEDVVVAGLSANTSLFEFCSPHCVGAATCLGGFLYVTAAHNFQDWLAAGKRGVVTPIGPDNGCVTPGDNYLLDETQVWFKPGADVAFFTITARPGRDLKKIMFADEFHVDALGCMSDALFMQRTGDRTRELSLRRLALRRVTRAGHVRVADLTIPVDAEKPLVVLAGTTVAGTSGAAVVVNTGKARVLVGVVTASGSVGVSVSVVSLADVDAARAALWVERAGVNSAPTFGAACRDELVDTPHPNTWIHYAKGVSFAGDLIGYSKVRENPRMSLARTAAYDALYPFLERYDAFFAAPAVGTSPVLVDGTVEYRSTYLTVARAFCHRTPPAGALVRAASEEYFGAYPDPPDWVRPLSIEEAVFGVPGEYDGVEPSTSSGQWGGSKRAWIDFQARTIDPRLREAVRVFIDKLPSAEVDALFFAYRHKDEGRSQKRVAEFKTRFFNVGDLHVFIAMRMLFLPVLRWLRLLPREVTECAVGVNAVSAQWEELHRPLEEFSDDAICGDFADYDKVSDPVLAVASSIGIQSVLARGRGYSAVARRALGVLIILCAFPVTKIDCVVLLLYGTSPSGVNGTTELNGWRGALTLRVAFLILMLERHPEHLDTAPGWFRRFVRSIWYGDDHRAASRRKWFNQLALREVLARWGDKYTDAAKSGDMREFTPCEEVTFLKRRILKWRGMWLAPLELKSVFRCGAYAVASTAGAMARDAQAIPNMMRELWLHRDAPELYDEVRGALLAAMPLKYGGGELTVELPTAEQQEALYVSGGYSTWDGGSPDWVTAAPPARDAVKLDLRVNGRSDIEDKTNAYSTAQTLNARKTSGAAYYRGGSESFLGPGVGPHLLKSVAKAGGQRQTMNSNSTMAGAPAPQGTAPMEGTSSVHSQAQLILNSADASNTFGTSITTPDLHTATFATEPGVAAEVLNNPSIPRPLSDGAGLEQWWQRPVLLFNTAWAPASAPAFFDPWTTYFVTPLVLRKAANFARFKGRMRLRFVVGGTNFHYGLMTFRYLPRHKDGFGPPHARLTASYDATLMSQLAGVDINVAGASTCELVLPFTSPFEWVDLALSANSGYFQGLDTLGGLYLKFYTALRHVTLATPPSVPISIYGWLEDATFAGPCITTYSTVTSGREAEPSGVFSRPLSVLAKAAAGVGGAVPQAAPYAMPLSAMASAASKVAAAFGYSKAVIPSAVTVVAGTPWSNTGTASGNDWVAPAGLDPAGALPPGGAVAGFPADEMSHTFFTSRESLLNPAVDGFLWQTTDSVGTRIVTVPIAPQVHVRTSATTVRLTPLGALAMLYNHWRGSLRVRIRAVASKFHQGRLVIWYVPAGTTTNAAGVPPTMLQSAVLDLSERTEVEFTIGYQATAPFLATMTSWARSNSSALECVVGGTGYNIPIDQFTNGALVIQVESALISPLTTNHVPVLVSISGGDDLEFVHHSARQLVSVSTMTSGKAYDRGPTMPLAPPLTSPPIAAVSTECFSHLRPLLARYQVVLDANLGRPVSSDYATNRIIIPARGWNTAYGLSTAPVDFLRPTIAGWYAASPTPAVAMNPFTNLAYLRMMFSGERGGLRWRAHHFDYGATEASVINVAASPWCDINNVTSSNSSINAATAVTSLAFQSAANTDGYQWGGDTEMSPVGVTVPYGSTWYYNPLYPYPAPPNTGAGTGTPYGVVAFDVYRRVVNSATTESNAAFSTNKFTLLCAAGDDFSLVGFTFTPLLTTT